MGSMIDASINAVINLSFTSISCFILFQIAKLVQKERRTKQQVVFYAGMQPILANANFPIFPDVTKSITKIFVKTLYQRWHKHRADSYCHRHEQ
jgi:hypothetical protein